MARPTPSLWTSIRPPAILAGWALVAFLTVRFQSQFPIVLGPRWIMAGAFGVSLLALWFGGWRAAAAVAAAAVLARGDGTYSWAETLAGVGGIHGGGLLFLAWRPFRHGLKSGIERPADTWKLIATLSSMSLALGVATGLVGLMIDPATAGQAALGAASISWLALAVCAPLTVAVRSRAFPDRRGWLGLVEAVLGLLGVVVCTALLFADGSPLTRDMPFPCFVLLAVFGTWVAFRFDVLGTAVVTLVVYVELLSIARFRGAAAPLFPLDYPWEKQDVFLVLIAGIFYAQLLVASTIRAWKAQAAQLTELNEQTRVQSRVELARQEEASRVIRESEDRLRFALKSAGMVTWDVEPDTGRIVRSESFREWLGLPPAERDLTGDEFLARVHPDDLARVKAAIPRFRHAEGDRIEYRILRGDGSIVWLSSSGRPVVGSDGKVIRAVGVHRDVTAERTSRDRLLLLESAVVHAHDAVVILDGSPTPGSGRCLLYVNDAFCKMTGYAREDVVGRTLHVLRGPASDPATLDALRTALDAGMSHRVELLNYKKDGSAYWVDLALEPVWDGDRLAHWVMIQRDVTRRRRAEDLLRESEAKFRGIFENAWAGVSITDASGVFVSVNPAFADLLGRRVDEVMGRFPREFTHPDDWVSQEPLTRAVQAGERDRYQVRKRYLKPDGTPVWTELWFAAIRGPAGEYRSGLGISVDVTERLRLEEQLRQAQKMEAFGQLAGGVAHDFNNLLTAILGNLALVRLPAGDPDRALVAAAEQAGTRAADLTRKLLGYARRTNLYLAPVRVGEVIDEVVDILRRTFDPRIVIRTEIGPAASVRADATLLNQVLFNLCLNSRDAIDGTGEVVLSVEGVELEPDATGELPDARPGSFVRVSVRDTGRGMDDDVRRRIFEPFFTTKAVGQGTGLGLAMVHGIMKQHGGWVACQSRYGIGTQFDLYFPVAADTVWSAEPSGTVSPSSATPVRSPAIARSAPAEPGTVLLVDDEGMIRNLARAVLESGGFSVIEAEDGIDAVDKFRDAHDQIDLVILDLTMPRMSGRDAFRQMTAIQPAARILFSSGYSADDVSDLGGAVGMLSKPYRPDNLLAAVRKALARDAVEA